MKNQGLIIGCLLATLVVLSISGCFEDKVQTEMASYYSTFSPKFKAMKESVPKEEATGPASETEISKNIAEVLQKFCKDLNEIQPKSSEIQELHGKLRGAFASAAAMAEAASQLPPEPDAAQVARLKSMQAEGERTVRDIDAVLRKIAAEHKSNEALLLLKELDLKPGS